MMMYVVQEDHEYVSIDSHLNEHEQKTWRKQLGRMVASQVLKEVIFEWKEKLNLRKIKDYYFYDKMRKQRSKNWII